MTIITNGYGFTWFDSMCGCPDRPSLLPHQNPPPSETSSGPGYVNQVPPSYSSSGYPAGTGYNSGGYASAVAAADSRNYGPSSGYPTQLTCHRLVQEVLMLFSKKVQVQVYESLLDANALNGSPDFVIAVNG
nr:hypothetical protein [Tanacetum cinerariifolium]